MPAIHFLGYWMKLIRLPDFKIRYVLTGIFYLVAMVTLVQFVNFLGVMHWGLDFLSWWPLEQAKLFGLGGVPEAILTAIVSGLAIEIMIPGLDIYNETHWLTREGLSLVTNSLFLAILGILKSMLVTVDVQKPFDFENIRRVQLIIVLLLIDVFVLDYWRTESMKPLKALVNQVGSPLVGTDSSYQNADAYAYILLLLLLTLLTIFRRGVTLLQQQRDLEKQLYQKQKLEAVGTLASGIGHDFNNILTSIIGYAELAKTEPQKEDIQFALDRVLDASYRAKQLTQQIRAIGGQQSFTDQVELIDLKDEVNELLLSIAPTIRSNITVLKQFDPLTRYSIMADSTKIYQVLLNICTNALQAMALQQGQLTIDICEQSYLEKAGYCLKIKDSGCGMSQQQQQHIFEPYFTTKKQLGGTGLGLSLCYSIVESYSGHISVTSELNKGSCINVWWPMAEVIERQTLEVAQPTQQLTKNISILVLDNDKSVLALVKRKLSGLGYQVTAFGDCNKALDAFRDEPEQFDLVVSDLNMPQMTGIEFTKKVRVMVSEQPVIIITATPELVKREQELMIINDVISKPIAFSELHTAIEAVFVGESWVK